MAYPITWHRRKEGATLRQWENWGCKVSQTQTRVTGRSNKGGNLASVSYNIKEMKQNERSHINYCSLSFLN